MIGESTTHTPDHAAELRAPRARGVALPGQRRPWGTWLIGFCATGLLLNALIGQHGYFESRRLEQQYLVDLAALHKLRADNQWLQMFGQALRSDPATIEDTARRQLGMIKPGEVLFIITDTPAAQPLQAAPSTSPSRDDAKRSEPRNAAPAR